MDFTHSLIEEHSRPLGDGPTKEFPFHLRVYYEIYDDLLSSKNLSAEGIIELAGIAQNVRHQIDLSSEDDEPLVTFQALYDRQIVVVTLSYVVKRWTDGYPMVVLMPTEQQVKDSITDN